MMMNKTFDCVEMMRSIRDKHWIDSGENIKGYLEYIDKRINKSELIKKFLERKEIAQQLKSAN